MMNTFTQFDAGIDLKNAVSALKSNESSSGSLEGRENEAKKDSSSSSSAAEAEEKSRRSSDAEAATKHHFCTSCDEEDVQLANVFCRLDRFPTFAGDHMLPAHRLSYTMTYMRVLPRKKL